MHLRAEVCTICAVRRTAVGYLPASKRIAKGPIFRLQYKSYTTHTTYDKIADVDQFPIRDRSGYGYELRE